MSQNTNVSVSPKFIVIKKPPDVLRKMDTSQTVLMCNISDTSKKSNNSILISNIGNNDNSNSKAKRSQDKKPSRKIVLDSYISANRNEERTRLVSALESDALGDCCILIKEESSQILHWLCPILNCNKRFLKKAALHVHILRHFNFDAMKCNIEGCSAEFINENSLEKHKNEIHRVPKINTTKNTNNIVDDALYSVGVEVDRIEKIKSKIDNRFLCSYSGCSLNFKTIFLLKNHLLTHYNLKPFKCTFEGCSKSFQTMYKLKSHKNVHEEENHIPCNFVGCGKKFSTKSNLMIHKRIHEQAQYLCPAKNCDKHLPSRLCLIKHLKSSHQPQEAAFKCSECSKTFWWANSLSLHMQIHSTEYVCTWEDCGRKFSVFSNLKCHLRTHTGENLYKCAYPSCGQTFITSGKLHRHAKKHTGSEGRNFVCEICGKAFLRLEHLNEHLQRHQSNQKNSCVIPDVSTLISYENQHSNIFQNGLLVSNMTDNAKNICLVTNNEMDEIKTDDNVKLSLENSQTAISWTLDVLSENVEQNILQLKDSCDENQSNPLVCGGVSLESENLAVSAGLELNCNEVSRLASELTSDLLVSAGEHMNSLLLQEDLSDSILYPSEEVLQVMLLSEHSGP